MINKDCFIICPIGHDDSDTRKRSDTVFKHIITPACECNDLKPVRIDLVSHYNDIVTDIKKYLKESPVAIADLTGWNPNVFFEIGYRVALDKPIISIKNKGEKIPFDIITKNTLEYDINDINIFNNCRDRLSMIIKACLSDIDSDNHVSVNENSNNFNQHIAEALFKIEDKLDFLNALTFGTDFMPTPRDPNIDYENKLYELNNSGEALINQEQ